MALGATIYTFEVALNDADRGVYEALSFRVARHPSETEEFLLTRVLAYCLEYAPGIEFSRGLSDPDVPAIAVRDLSGVLTAWIDIGAPDAERLHKAAKLAPQVAVYCHRDVEALLARLGGARIHRAQDIRIHSFAPGLIAALVGHLERRLRLDLTVTDGHLYLTVGDDTLSGAVEGHRLNGPA